MCLYLCPVVHRRNYPIDMLRAERPLLVRKTLHLAWNKQKWHSPFYGLEYEFGFEQRSDLVLVGFNVDEGLHSYRLGYRSGSFPFRFGIIYKDKFKTNKMFPAIIPPGGLFYVGSNHDIVSDRLIVYNSLHDVIERWGPIDYEAATKAYALRAYHERTSL